MLLLVLPARLLCEGPTGGQMQMQDRGLNMDTIT